MVSSGRSSSPPAHWMSLPIAPKPMRGFAGSLRQDPDAVPEWRDLPGRTGGEGPGRGPRSPVSGEKLENVATSGGFLVLPLSSADALGVSPLTEEVLDVGRGTETGWRSGGIPRRRPQGP